MVWDAIGHMSRTPVVHISSNLNSNCYISEMLRPVALPYFRGLDNCMFQQDNVEVAHTVLTFLDTEHVRLLSWPRPACSPDLSPI